MGNFFSSGRYMRRQGKLFDRSIEDLIGKGYENKYVAFENGVVLDSDPDEHVLATRVHEKFGWQKPIYIAMVLREKDRKHAMMPSFNQMRKE